MEAVFIGAIHDMAKRSDTIRAQGRFFCRRGEKWLLKGVSYGPFDGPDSLPGEDQAARDLRHIAAMGLNTLRVYALPPEWFLDLCGRCGLQVLIGLQWPAHTDFLRDGRAAGRILREAREAVRRLGRSPAVLGFFIGNEIPATMVRWIGAVRVRRFLERMIDRCRAEAPDALFAYATYPSTEYLNPRNADFISYNVYLEDREDFERYLARLQNIAGDRPLVISEFGLDTHRHGEAAQAETLTWAWEAAVRAGLAGQIIFAYTDEWFTAGRDMVDWEFGLVTRDRTEKDACVRLGAWLPSLSRPGQGVRLRAVPRISVIICTYNGARTLRRALESTLHLAYPDFEVLVVDDGSTDGVPDICAGFREARHVRIEHAGLSAARNAGARHATGEIFAYLDDDAAADSDWLTYLALAFERDRVGAAGGPNVPLEESGFVSACVAAAPGGPSHVLVNDVDAEHLPGCNLAVSRAALEEVGGFDERYRTAGDDVDFCWRLIDHGYRIAFHAGAVVHHERRRTVRAFFRQQIGYGSAEALLIRHHRHRFGKLGGARWRGAIYEAQTHCSNGLRGFIYRGPLGGAPYQFLYATPHSAAIGIATSIHWVIAAAVVAIGGIWNRWALAVAVAMFLTPVVIALRLAFRSRVPAPHHSLRARLVVFWLSLIQPIARGAARLLGCARRGVFPSGPWLTRPIWPAFQPRGRKAVSDLALWNEHGRDRDLLLRAITEELSAAGWLVIPGDAWVDWDLEIERGRWWIVRVTTVTEFHQKNGRLTRVRLSTRATGLTLALAAAFVVIILPLAFATGPVGLWSLVLSFLVWLALEFHHGAIASQVMRLVLHAARLLGFRRLEAAPAPPRLDSDDVPAASATPATEKTGRTG